MRVAIVGHTLGYTSKLCRDNMIKRGELSENCEIQKSQPMIHKWPKVPTDIETMDLGIKKLFLDKIAKLNHISRKNHMDDEYDGEYNIQHKEYTLERLRRTINPNLKTLRYRKDTRAKELFSYLHKWKE